MSDVRARLAEALRNHFKLHRAGRPEEWVCGGCHADFHNFQCHEDHVADVLLSLEGVAIVGLPTRVGSRWPVDDEDDFAVSIVELIRASDAFAAKPRRHPGCKVEWGSVELNLCTRDARALAAALLAATDVAEVATS